MLCRACDKGYAEYACKRIQPGRISEHPDLSAPHYNQPPAHTSRASCTLAHLVRPVCLARHHPGALASPMDLGEGDSSFMQGCAPAAWASSAKGATSPAPLKQGTKDEKPKEPSKEHFSNFPLPLWGRSWGRGLPEYLKIVHPPTRSRCTPTFPIPLPTIILVTYIIDRTEHNIYTEPKTGAERNTTTKNEGDRMKNLLIVVDYQNDFVTGSLGFPKAADLEPHIANKIKEYKGRGDDVVFTLDTHTEDYAQTQEGRNLPVPHCLRGSEGWQLYGAVAALCDETTPLFEKGSFGSLALANHLAGQAYDRIELVGLVSNICVISNAVLAKAALPEARIVVDAACTASFDDRLNEETLDVLQGLQIEVTNR